MTAPRKNPYAAGAAAALAGRLAAANPYERGTDEHALWNKGYYSIADDEWEDDDDDDDL